MQASRKKIRLANPPCRGRVAQFYEGRSRLQGTRDWKVRTHFCISADITALRPRMPSVANRRFPRQTRIFRSDPDSAPDVRDLIASDNQARQYASLNGWIRMYDSVKRIFDVLAALVAGLIAAPVAAFIALLLWCAQGAVLFRQVRPGLGGRPFTLYKFCTMSLSPG